MEQVAPWPNTEITAYDSKSFMYRQSRWQHNNLSNLLIITQQCLRPPRRTCQRQLYLCCCCSRCRLMSQFPPKPRLLRWRKRRVWVTLFVIFVVVIIIDLVVAASGVLVIDFCLVPVRCSVVAPGANNSAEIHRHTHAHTNASNIAIAASARSAGSCSVSCFSLLLVFILRRLFKQSCSRATQQQPQQVATTFTVYPRVRTGRELITWLVAVLLHWWDPLGAFRVSRDGGGQSFLCMSACMYIRR